MKFVCDRCQTKYSIADEKVRGKVLKVRCKTCQNVITVREPGARPSHASMSPVRPSQKPSTGPLATFGEADEPVERTQLAAMPAAFMAELAQSQPRRATPPPPPPVGDGIEWFLALEGAQQGPFSRKGLVDKLIAMPKDADVHVWNDGMDGWKPPKDVPDVARDLALRKPPAVPVRRATPAPPVPPLAARRPPTQPLASGVGHKLPVPTMRVTGAHAVPAPYGHEDPAAGLPTPPPLAPGPLGRKTNGVHAAVPAAAYPVGESDALSALNMNVATAAKPPRLMEVGAATSWAGQPTEGKKTGTAMVVALMAVVGVIIVVGVLSFGKKPAPVVASTTPPKGAVDTEALARTTAALAEEKRNAPAVAPTPAPATEPARAGGKGQHGRPTRGAHPTTGRGTSPSAFTGTAPSGGTPVAAADPNSRYTETGGRNVTPSAAVSHRPAPSQGDITRVISNNKLGIKTCYQRALLRDSNLTHGKIVVGVTIGISGRVKSTKVDGPASFRALEPCIREMVGRWTFPQSYEEYGTEFSYVFQGNE